MLVISDQYQTHNADVKVSRMLPRANWIHRNDRMLNEVMGNMDALTAAKDQSIAFHCEMTTRPHSSTSSQNTDALFGAAVGGKKLSAPEKGRAHKERSKRPHIISGSDYMSDMDVSQGYDWTACDKDCGWCGRCYY